VIVMGVIVITGPLVPKPQMVPVLAQALTQEGHQQD